MQTRIMKKVCTSVVLSHDKTNMQQIIIVDEFNCPFDLSNSQCDIERDYNSDDDSGEVDDSATGDYYTINF